MGSSLLFPPFRIDASSGEVWRGGEVVRLRPKALALLRQLSRQPGRLFSKEELLEAVWPEVVVSDIAVKVCIRELRRALRDSAEKPRFIETVPRRGYRFIGRIEPRHSRERARLLGSNDGPRDGAPRDDVFVGRETELETLREALARGVEGERQVLFVTGEPGIGKTTLLAEFLGRLPEEPRCWVARGHCIEAHGAGEPYLPLLEAVERLCRAPSGKPLVSLLREHAPSWLVQLPGLVSPEVRSALRRQCAGAGRDRMLRELLVGLESITREHPLVLALEDLHWSDPSTLDLLASLGRGDAPARLLLVATCRPIDPAWADTRLASLVADLTLHRRAAEIRLARLERRSVEAFLRERLAGSALAEPVVAAIHRCTDGNPLFLANLADDLAARGLFRFDGGRWSQRVSDDELLQTVPHNLAAVIRSRLETLGVLERRILETASVAGSAFAPGPVAEALGEEPVVVNERCAALARADAFLRTIGETQSPCGSVAPLYGFAHEFHRSVLYDGVAPARRRTLHGRIARGLEAAWDADVAEIAGELAVHFEHSAERQRAVPYRHLAAERAVQRHAYGEAVEHVNRGLAILEGAPPSAERDRRELELRMVAGVPLLGTQGFASPAARHTYSRALELSRRVGDTKHLFPALEGLHSFYAVRGDLRIAYDLARRMHRIARSRGDRDLLVEAHHVLGNSEFRRGRLRAARSHLEKAIELYGPRARLEAYAMSGHDPRVCCASCLGVVEWMLGHPDRALHWAERGIALAREVGQPFSVALALIQASWVRMLRREAGEAQVAAESALAMAANQGFIYFSAIATMFRGWALSARGQAEAGIGAMSESAGFLQAIGAGGERVGLLAISGDVHLAAQDSQAARACIAEAFRIVRRSGERYAEPELYRLRGEAALAAGDETRAGADFRRAAAAARRSGARGFELRAALSLARLRNRQGKGIEVREMLVRVQRRFDEGLATADVAEATETIRRLGSH